MPLLNGVVTIDACGQPRSVCVLEENPKGDLYIRLRSGRQVGFPPNATRLRQSRFSIHPSDESPNFSTIKHTVELQGQPITTTVAITDAVKKKTGFATIFSRRCSAMGEARYDVSSNLTNLSIGSFNPREQTPIMHVLVGAPDVTFHSPSGGIDVYTFLSNRFQLVVCVDYLPYPANASELLIINRTFAPEIFADEDGEGKMQAIMRRQMEGSPATACINMFLKAFKPQFEADHLKSMLHFERNNPIRCAQIQGLLSRLPPEPMKDLGQGLWIIGTKSE